LGRIGVRRGANCTDVQGDTFEMHGRAKYFRDFC
jgi:hypothetical protein